MKKLLFTLLTVCLFMNCSKSANDPIYVATDFAKTYLEEHDLNTYVKYLKTETREKMLAGYQDPKYKEYENKQKEACKALKFQVTLDKEKSMVGENDASIYFNIKSEINPKYNQNGVRADMSKDLDGKWFVKYYTFPTRFDI